MKITVQHIISRFPVILVFIFVAVDLLLRNSMATLVLTQDEALLYQKIGKLTEISFLFAEITALLFVLYMYLHVLDRRKTQTRFCFYHKFAIYTLGAWFGLKILAIMTPMDFDLYNSIVTQVSVFIVLMVLLYFTIRGK